MSLTGKGTNFVSQSQTGPCLPCGCEGWGLGLLSAHPPLTETISGSPDTHLSSPILRTLAWLGLAPRAVNDGVPATEAGDREADTHTAEQREHEPSGHCQRLRSTSWVPATGLVISHADYEVSPGWCPPSARPAQPGTSAAGAFSTPVPSMELPLQMFPFLGWGEGTGTGTTAGAQVANLRCHCCPHPSSALPCSPPLPSPLGLFQISALLKASKPSPVTSHGPPLPWNERPWGTCSPLPHLLPSPTSGALPCWEARPYTRSCSFHHCRTSGPLPASPCPEHPQLTASPRCVGASQTFRASGCQ